MRETLGRREGEGSVLRERVQQLESEAAGLRASLDAKNAQLTESERLVGQLQANLGQEGDLVQRYSELSEEYAALLGRHDQLAATHAALQERIDSLVPIRTPELSGDALLLDRSVKGITWTGAVCSGSMEPNIGCEDLLLVYEPRVTDLDVGDIIYFRTQAPGCTGATPNSFMLHRIRRVVFRSSGVWFETKGDALSAADACLVPASDVLYKLLTNVRNARVMESGWAVTGGGTAAR
jgi:signal peptidase I